MKSFIEFTQDTQSQKPPNQMNTGPIVNNGENEDAVFEDLSNSLRRVLETKLFPALDKNKLNKQKAMQLLSGLVAEVANRYGLTGSNVRQATQNGMKTNSEPTTVPMQPQAVG